MKQQILDFIKLHETLLLAMSLYVSITIAVVAMIDVSRQSDIIIHQQDTLTYMTGELIETQQSMQEMRSDYDMLEELGK